MYKSNKRFSFVVSIITTISVLAFLLNNFNLNTTTQVQAQTPNTDWYTVAANAQRTSYVDRGPNGENEIKKSLKPEWFYRINPYISRKVQPIITGNTAYISSSKGLYALKIDSSVSYDSNRQANTSTLKWIYCTSTESKITSGECPNGELPLGNSPTVINSIAYVGGFDKKVHAIDVNTGNKIWVSAEAGGGFHANPLVIGSKLFIGNRDGYMYALNLNDGSVAWKFKTGGPILQSAAASKDGTKIFFASNDMHTYAVKATTTNPNGEELWQSPKLPGTGFHSYWPVVTEQDDPYDGTSTKKEYVIFYSLESYGNVNEDESEQIFCTARANRKSKMEDGVSPRLLCVDRTNDAPWCPTNTGNSLQDDNLPCNPLALPTVAANDTSWVAPGTQMLYASQVSNYYEKKPYRRVVFIFNTASGQEYTFDYDNDGGREYAPISHTGADAGSNYPSAVGANGVLYQRTSVSEGSIPRAAVVGWKFGTPWISNAGTVAVDEPSSYSIGGYVIYGRLMGQRYASAKTYDTANSTNYTYYSESLAFKLPELFRTGWPYSAWKHGDVSPPVPYNNKVYILENNALVSYAASGADTTTQERGYDTGSKRSVLVPSTSTTMPGAFGLIAAESNTWPKLLYQESYFAHGLNEYQYFSPFSVAADTGSPTGINLVKNPNNAKEMTTTFSGGTLKTRVSEMTPTILLENTSTKYILQGSIEGIAYKTATGVQRITDTGSVNVNAMSEGWLLIWDDDTVKPLELDTSGNPKFAQPQFHRWHPMVITLQKQPASISLDSSGLTITYSGAAGYMTATPLYGLSAPIPGKEAPYKNDRSNTELTNWKSGTTGNYVTDGVDAIALASEIAKVSQSFPTAWTENYAVVGSDAEVTYNYTARTEFSTWKTAASAKSFIPPIIALAAWKTSPIQINNQPLSSHWQPPYKSNNPGYPLPFGRWAGVTGTNQVKVTFPGLANYWKGSVPSPQVVSDTDPVQALLENEIAKMDVDNNGSLNHFRPGYVNPGILFIGSRNAEWLFEYFHNPGETMTTLIQALPYLTPATQTKVRSYLAEVVHQYFPPESTVHVGYELNQPGKPQLSRREFHDPVYIKQDETKDDFEASLNQWGPVDNARSTVHWLVSTRGWNYSPPNFYALWLYAKEFGGASVIFDNVETKLEDPFVMVDQQYGDRFRVNTPYMINSYIMGHIGYLKLATLAGEPTQNLQDEEQRLIRLFIMRSAYSKNPESVAQTKFENSGYHWTIDAYRPHLGEIHYERVLMGTIWSQYNSYGYRLDNVYLLQGSHVGGNYTLTLDFINMTPELGKFMRDYVPQEMTQQITTHENEFPYWFVTRAEEAGGEVTLHPLTETIALFQAKQYGLGETRQQLEKYLDVPAFERGDLYYIQKLTGILSATSDGSPIPTVTPTPTGGQPTPTPNLIPGDTNGDGRVDLVDLATLLSNFGLSSGATRESGDLDGSGSVNLLDLSIVLTNFGTSSGGTTPTPTATPTPASGSTPTLTPTPAQSGQVITNVSSSTVNAPTLDTSLAVGDSVYTDRTFTFTTIPSSYLGKEYIQTANADKSVIVSDYLTFTLSQDASVYVAYDSRATVLPAWLNDGTWTTTGEMLGTTDVAHKLYRKDFPAGQVTLGGNTMAPMSGAGSNYGVVAIPN